MSSRLDNFNLGVNLGWLQQGAAFGGRPIHEMTADLQRVRATAATAAYAAYDGLVATAAGKLNSGQSANSALQEISELIRIFQSQASGPNAYALTLGIVLGWLQQGARANNRLVSLATGDLESARGHARSAGYNSYDGYINDALTKLASGQPIHSIEGEATALIGLFQGSRQCRSHSWRSCAKPTGGPSWHSR